MIVREMRAEDASEVAAIEKSIFSQPWSAQGFLDAMAMEDNIILLAEHEEEVVGYVCMYVSFDEGEITNVAVSESHRGQGYAEAILTSIMDRARAKGVANIFLEVRKSNAPAIGLYKKLCFEEIGIRKNFYDFPKEDAIVMRYLSAEMPSSAG